MKRIGLFFVLLSLHATAAIDPAQYPEKVRLNVAEILSLPVANRIAVSQNRRGELVEPLRAMIFDDKADFGHRWKAVLLYAQLEKSKSAKVLHRALESKEWFLRNAALLAFAEVFPPAKAAEVAARLMNDKALVVRSAAVDVLARHMDSQTREILWNEIDQAHNFRKKQGLWIRPQILKILAEEPAVRELPLFLTYLREGDSRMHSPAISALEKITREVRGGQREVAEKRTEWLKWARSAKVEGSL